MADGGSVKSKTSWKGQQLVTKAKERSTLGSMEVDEARSLSADGNTLTINLTFKGSSPIGPKRPFMRGKNLTQSLSKK